MRMRIRGFIARYAPPDTNGAAGPAEYLPLFPTSNHHFPADPGLAMWPDGHCVCYNEFNQLWYTAAEAVEGEIKR